MATCKIKKPYEPGFAWTVNSVNTTGVTITLPTGSGTYLIVCGHNTNSANNGMWIYRASGSAFFNIGGGSGITLTGNGATITAKSASQNPQLYYTKIG